MHQNNVSYVFILGFQHFHSFNSLVFLFVLFIYCITLSMNIIITTLISMSKNLHSPMYFFITQVSLLDVVISTDILPNLIHIILHEGVTMSLNVCISQFYVFASSVSSECFVLMVMSYDRYVAICNPLRYNSIINKSFCVTSVIASWVLGILMVLMNVIAIYKLDFCGPDIIDHFFCDLTPILKLSCSDISFIQIQTTLYAIIGLFPFTIIIVSYCQNIITILSIKSVTGRQKAFSTCSSHLTVVSIFYGSICSVYMVPNRGQFLAISKGLSLLYTMVTPLLNPFIYSLRNKDFKKAVQKLKHRVNYFNCGLVIFNLYSVRIKVMV